MAKTLQEILAPALIPGLIAAMRPKTSGRDYVWVGQTITAEGGTVDEYRHIDPNVDTPFIVEK